VDTVTVGTRPEGSDEAGPPEAEQPPSVEGGPDEQPSEDGAGSASPERPDPCPRPATNTDRAALLALAEARPDDPTGGPRVLATFTGRASYSADSLAGHRTASGERYDPALLTAANRDLPFDTVLRVTRIDTGQSVIVRVNDRGPFGDRHRVLDLSRAAAERIDMVRAGVVEVRVEVIARP
jgi:rare lipoprotein A